MDLVVLLFEKFETLDVFGPVEVLGKLAAIARISFVSLPGGPVVSSQQVPVATQGIDSFLPEPGYILLIPGGAGTRTEIDNQDLLEAIKRLASGAGETLAQCKTHHDVFPNQTSPSGTARAGPRYASLRWRSVFMCLGRVPCPRPGCCSIAQVMPPLPV